MFLDLFICNKLKKKGKNRCIERGQNREKIVQYFTNKMDKQGEKKQRKMDRSRETG